ncbi:MAG: hypothetical protein A2V70_05670 [Planctomycetes bacterium RBG_13_63_9]|nr:MAG: hypothetical protein A2V70_05670 [Planctomycetes bacterium RBG_13_63_9]
MDFDGIEGINELVVRQPIVDRLGATGSASAPTTQTLAEPVAPNEPTCQFSVGGPLDLAFQKHSGTPRTIVPSDTRPLALRISEITIELDDGYRVELLSGKETRYGDVVQ